MPLRSRPYGRGLLERRQLDEGAATIWPIGFAIGIAVLLVGLIVNPFLIASLGGAITLIAGFGWVRGTDRTGRPATFPRAGER